MPLAALLLGAIPGLINSVLQIISAIRADDGTPAEMKAKLDQISLDLVSVTARVAAVQLPNPPLSGMEHPALKP